MTGRLCCWTLAACLLSLAPASALELKNVRPCYGPQGATRTDVKCQPGDVLFITYDIEGLVINDKTGKANYVTTLEFLDAKDKVLYEKKSPNEVAPQLGGTRMPGDLHIIVPPKMAPGKYTVRLTITDRQGKDTKKSFQYPFEITGETFGMTRVVAPVVGFPGDFHTPEFFLVNMKLVKDQADVEVAMKLMDDKGKLIAAPIMTFLPKDLPEEIDLKKVNVAPMRFPIYLNRTGRFEIEVTATDKNAKQTVTLRYPLTVLDLATIGGK